MAALYVISTLLDDQVDNGNCTLREALLAGPRVLGLGLDLGALERDALFADDFERGDVGAWGAAGE